MVSNKENAKLAQLTARTTPNEPGTNSSITAIISNLREKILDVLHTGRALIWLHCLHFTYANTFLLQDTAHGHDVGVSDVIVQFVVGRKTKIRFAARRIVGVSLHDFGVHLAEITGRGQLCRRTRQIKKLHLAPRRLIRLQFTVGQTNVPSECLA